MNRRELLATVGRGALAAPLLATGVVGRLAGATGSLDAGAARRSAFHAALAERPWLACWTGLDVDEIAPARLPVEGRLPEGLRGSLYRNGPARNEIGDFRYAHWFDGDGMVHAWRFDDAGVEHRARMVHTPKYLAERDAGRPLYPAFGTTVDDHRALAGPDTVNPANISVLPRDDGLWALWEAGSPVDLDPETLETKGFRTFSAQTQGLPFSAHPRLGPDGRLWNFGYAAGARRLVFWRIERDGSLGKVTTLAVPDTGAPHDFVVTERHLVLLIAPLTLDPELASAGNFLDVRRWRPQEATRVLVMRLDDLQTHFWTELPAQWVFHYGNAFEDRDGVIRFDGASAERPDFMFGTARALMRGEAGYAGEARTRHYLYRIDTRRRTASQSPLVAPTVHTEFPTIDLRRSTLRHRWVTLLLEDGDDAAVHGSQTSVARLDLETGDLESYRYPDEELPEEHVFVPAPGGSDETQGWLVGTSLDWKAKRTHLNVFDADAVADGPIARASLPLLLPAGLHGRFASAAA